MIRREGERQKRTKNLPLNPPCSSSNANVSSHQVITRDIPDHLPHKESAAGQPSSSTAFGSAPSPGIPKSESMQIKAEYMNNTNAAAAPQNSIAGIGGEGGVLQVSSGATSDSRTGNAVKSAQSGYRQKALQQIRISLLPFANSDKANSELSSASSTTSDSSSPSQTSGNCSSSVVSGHSSSSGQNGLDKDLNAHPHVLQQLLAMGYTEEAAVRLLKLGKATEIETLLKQADNSQSVGINGLTRTSHGLGPLPLKPLRKSSLQDGLGQRGSCSSTVDSSSASTRSDSPSVNLGNLHSRLLPDSPRILGQCMDNSSNLLSHVHGQLSKQHAQNFPPNDPPPPPPPPRGMPGPPPTPPRGTTPPPPSSASQGAQFVGSSGLVSSQMQHYLKRISPVPQNCSRPQALSYTSSSVSSSSSPQRGTSPVSFGRTPHLMSSIGQSQQQLAQQLQNLSLYPSTRVDPPPPYPSGSSHSPASLSSQYSSPPPSYAASSSSGRQSPTPTISSSEYSVPPVLNLQQLQKRGPPVPSSSSPAHVSSSPAVTAATVVTSVLPRSSVLQACSARQAKSQSPIIMQSVKSTQVQKPVLQTAIAPTSPPVNPNPPSFSASSQPVYAASVPGQATSHVPAASSHVHTSFAVGVQAGCANQPSYASVPNPLSYQAHSAVPNPPPYPAPTHQNQANSTQAYSSVMWHQSQNPPPPPPYTATASLGQQTNSASQFSSVASSQASNPPPYPSSAAGQSSNPPPPPYTSALQQQLGSTANAPLQNQQHLLSHEVPSPLPPYSSNLQDAISSKSAAVNNSPMYTQSLHNQNALRQESLPPAASLHPHAPQVATTVPTTDPPSYASSVAALAAQRAAAVGSSVINNNVPTFNSNVGPPTHCAYTTASSASSVTTVPGNSNLVSNRIPVPATSDLVTTVESICSSQVTALQGTNSNILRNNLNDMQSDNYSMFSAQQLQRKPSPVAMDTGSSASRSASRSESPVSHGMSQSPVSFMSTASTSSPSTQSDSTHDSARVPSAAPPYKHHSPIPPRKQLSKEKEEERRETKVRNYSPAAFKFFMEQHVENLLKSHQQREHRRQQLESEMAKVGLSEEAQCQMRRMLHQKESNYIRLKRAKMDKSMFVKIKTIGVGAFGEVTLVKKVDTNQLYAMKTLRKTDVLKRNQVAHVKAERDILAEADNEWVVKLYYSFQDKDNLYFVMDYISGGDLMSLLIKFGIFQEPLARFYVAELVLAVESVHKMGFIHRDIKPDNILIDKDGHIKLTDFGLCTGFRWTHNSKYYQRNGEHARQDSMDPDENWSNECHCNSSTNLKPLERRRRREHQRCLAHSLVGTPNYIAPEVLMRTGYTQICDWWSVGVILYEMLVGQPPFLANTPAETQYKVINWETSLHIPKAASLSTEATDLILKLCCGPDQRLGKNGADEIKKHAFFNAIDFEGGLRKQPAPYIPRIRYPTDTSNFDPIDPDKLRNSSGSSGDGSKSEETYENGKHPEHAFFEFTFRRFFDDGGQAYPVRIPLDDNENQGSPVYV